MARKKSQTQAPDPEKRTPRDENFAQPIANDRLHLLLAEFNLDDVDLELLSEFREPTSISGLKGEYRLCERSLYYRAAKLVSKGLVTSKKAGTVKLYSWTPGGEKVIAKCLGGSERAVASSSQNAPSCQSTHFSIRNHNILYEMPIHTQPKALRKMLEKGNWVTGVKHQNMTNWIRDYGDYQFNGFIAHVSITTQKVIVRLKDIWEEDVAQAVARGADLILEVKRELEETFSWPGHRAFRLGNWARRNVAIVRGSHQAILHHPLAEKCKGIGYTINGTSWTIDASKGIPEAEATDPGFSADDADHEHRDLQERSRARVGVMDLKAVIEDMSQILNKLIEHNKVITAQVQSNTDSNGNFNQLLLQQQQFFTQLIMQQNQQIMTALSAFQRHLEQSKGGVN